MTATKTAALEVAVIGAGAAGLAAARVFSRNGMSPIVLEQASSVGGVWDYRTGAESKEKPMYQNLRTNLPKELMAYREKKWTTDGDRSYLTHQEVLEYLKDYKSDFELDRFIRYNSKVTQLTIMKDSMNANDSKLRIRDEILPKIRVEWQESPEKICTDGDGEVETKSQVFDAVCVANGHYAKPSVPSNIYVPSNNKVKTMHSMEYNDPNDFRDQRVLCIGGRASGSDLARELSQTAKHVYVSYSGATNEGDDDKLSHVPRTTAVHADGIIEFEGDSTANVQVDVVIYCTGYDYQFPFLNDQSQLPNEDEDFSVQPGERRVKPLYKHLIHAALPNLSFPGLQHSVVPFPYVEFQAEALAKELLIWSSSSGDSCLPDRTARYQAAAVDAALGGAKQTGRVQDTHYLGGGQWDYCREMAKMAQLYNQDIEDYISTNQAIYEHSGQERGSSPPGSEDNYRETRYKRNNGKGGGFEVLYSGVSAVTAESSS